MYDSYTSTVGEYRTYPLGLPGSDLSVNAAHLGLRPRDSDVPCGLLKIHRKYLGT